MTFRVLTGVVAIAAWAAAGTGAAVAQHPPAPEMPARTVMLIVNDPVGDKMEYSRKQIVAKPGERLRVQLLSMGKLPKVAMAHNWLLLKLGSDPKKFADAAAGAKDTDFIPRSLKHQIIAETGLVGPGEKSEVVFTVPKVLGTYPFLCSSPGHYDAGMKGDLIVK